MISAALLVLRGNAATTAVVRRGRLPYSDVDRGNFSFWPDPIGGKIRLAEAMSGQRIDRGAFVSVIELVIAPGQAAGSFRVEVVRSAAGEARAEIALSAHELFPELSAT